MRILAPLAQDTVSWVYSGFGNRKAILNCKSFKCQMAQSIQASMYNWFQVLCLLLWSPWEESGNYQGFGQLWVWRWCMWPAGLPVLALTRYSVIEGVVVVEVMIVVLGHSINRSYCGAVHSVLSQTLDLIDHQSNEWRDTQYCATFTNINETWSIFP